MSLFVSLGDSIASGEGVGLRVPPTQTWPRLVAAQAGARFVGLARGGTPMAGALREQLPLALRLRPDVACLCVGLNDLLRSGGAPDQAETHLRNLVNPLYAGGTAVVAARLHDPSTFVNLPSGMARVVSRHVAAVNAALDSLAESGRVELVDLGGLELPGSWSVDRLHPSVFGHRVLAGQASRVLGLAAPVVPVAPPTAPTYAQWWRWLVKDGSVWALRKLPELATSEPMRAHSRAALGRVHRPKVPVSR
ncbi:MAG: GDSL-type esterase/lipase family protein [Sporichthyaceae bacterium]